MCPCDVTYDSPTEMGWPEIPNGDREICREISRRTGLNLISGWPGDQSTIFSDSCLIFRTWLWIGTPFCEKLPSLLNFMFSIFWIKEKVSIFFSIFFFKQSFLANQPCYSVSAVTNLKGTIKNKTHFLYT